MNLKIATKILNKYVKCPMCGNDKLGNGHGTLIIEDEVLERSCRCGFIIRINKDEEVKSREKKEDLITLELLCLETISQSKWTRASSLSTKCFDRIRSEYDQNLVTTEIGRAHV